MNLIRVNDINFKEHTSGFDCTILTFSANWCGKCKLLKPRLKQLARERNASIGYFEAFIEDSILLRDRFEIEHVPSTLALKNGKVVAKTHNTDENSMREMIDVFNEFAQTC